MSDVHEVVPGYQPVKWQFFLDDHDSTGVRIRTHADDLHVKCGIAQFAALAGHYVAVIHDEGDDRWTWVVEDINAKAATGVVASLSDAINITTAFVTQVYRQLGDAIQE